VWLRPAAGARAPAPRAGGSAANSRPRWDLAGLPAGAVRLEYRGGAAAHHAVRLEGREATVRDGVWSVVLDRLESGPRRLHASGMDANGVAWSDTATVWTVVRPGESAALPAVAGAPWTAASQFEPGPVAIAEDTDPLELPAELTPVQPAFDVLPAGTPLRTAWRFASATLAGTLAAPRVAFYHVGREGWEWCGAIPDSVHHRIAAESRLLGRFAVCEDTQAPRITLRRTPRLASKGPYSAWALVAALVDEGSGVNVKATHFIVDGRARPSEWDGVRSELRWRPLHAPKRGPHHFTVIAVDRAGNVGRASGTFVLD
jgi:hypothetical protein